MSALERILEKLQKARERWCAETVDDPEEMWLEVPELLDDIVPKLEEVVRLEGSDD